MKIQDMEGILRRAVERLFKAQPNIFSFTSETGQTEWNLAHHLANEIHKDPVLSTFDHDLDVTKRNLGKKRPDIIFHRRCTHCENFLVVEMKRNGSQSKVGNDIRKIKEDWFGPKLHYQFGAVINIRDDKTYEVCVFSNPGLHSQADEGGRSVCGEPRACASERPVAA
ncbi:MAG: hypothetical protein WA624_03925 [Methylocella sp.]